MGNLPGARTITIAPGDPIPSGLLGEIQDCITGAKRGLVTRRFIPTMYHQTVANFWAGATNPSGADREPVLKASTGGAPGLGASRFSILHEEGETLVGMSIQLYGDNNAELQITANYATGPGIVASVVGNVVVGTGVVGAGVPVGWAVYQLVVAVPQLIAAGSLFVGQVSYQSSNGTASVWIGEVTATFIHN